MWKPNTWSVTAGEEAKIVLHLFDSNGDPLNIAGATDVCLMFKLASGGYLNKQAESGYSYGRQVSPLYCYGFSYTPDETLSLVVAQKQRVLVKISFGVNNVWSYFIKDALNVEALTL